MRSCSCSRTKSHGFENTSSLDVGSFLERGFSLVKIGLTKGPSSRPIKRRGSLRRSEAMCHVHGCGTVGEHLRHVHLSPLPWGCGPQCVYARDHLVYSFPLKQVFHFLPPLPDGSRKGVRSRSKFAWIIARWRIPRRRRKLRSGVSPTHDQSRCRIIFISAND